MICSACTRGDHCGSDHCACQHRPPGTGQPQRAARTDAAPVPTAFTPKRFEARTLDPPVSAGERLALADGRPLATAFEAKTLDPVPDEECTRCGVRQDYLGLCGECGGPKAFVHSKIDVDPALIARCQDSDECCPPPEACRLDTAREALGAPLTSRVAVPVPEDVEDPTTASDERLADLLHRWHNNREASGS